MSSTHPIRAPKKLIEVALPLDDINREAAREKSIRHGHPSTLHLWWARRPLAAARAVIFAQLVNDPASLWEHQNPGLKPSQQQRGGFTRRRRYLFELIAGLVKWENTNNEALLQKAREEIRQSWRDVCALNRDHRDAATLFDPERLPGLHDPFAGGGAIPLEAQRLGLEATASDLNPVAVLINKAMIEIPPKFSGCPPVHPDALTDPKNYGRDWQGACGLAEDVRRYGAWMRQEAVRRIGHLYPKVEVTADIVRERPDLAPYLGQKLTVMAWIWARTVKSPNPAFSHVEVPLVSNFVLARKPGKEAWVQPIVDDGAYRFTVRACPPPAGAKNGTKSSGSGASFRCVLSDTAISGEYVRSEAQAGRMGARLMAIVLEGGRSRLYIAPTSGQEQAAGTASPTWSPDVAFFQRALGFRVGNYGMTRWSDLFTPRQLTALETFSNLVVEARERVRADAERQPGANDPAHTESYAKAVGTYLALAVDRSADFWCALCTWANQPKNELVSHVFTKQTLTMNWDFAEASPFSNSGGNFIGNLNYVAKSIDRLPATRTGQAVQAPAQAALELQRSTFVSTDPPYYDNIGYADLSDFFYVWLRKSQRTAYPGLFSTISVPKADELVATPHRHGNRAKAEAFFLDGMTEALRNMANKPNLGAPTTIYYAFKQAETSRSSGTSSTGWETFLAAVIRSGFAITGTWPIRTERSSRSRGIGSNALASSIVLVCRHRGSNAETISRRQFIRELNAVLPEALDQMTMGAGEDQSSVAPVDLSQAIIGPGMAVFSKYALVLEADGTPMTVKSALQLINRFLAEDDFDADTQFCLHWFEQNGWDEGLYGEADVLARAKATSVGGVVEAGVLFSGSGKVRLRKWHEYPDDWDPATDTRLPVWEALHQLIRAFKKDGESGAGNLLGAVKDKTEAVRQLAYRLYTLCERRGWAEDARAYNELVTSWSAVEAVASTVPDPVKPAKQLGLDLGGDR